MQIESSLVVRHIMAKYKSLWIAFDGETFDTEMEATAYEAELHSLGLKEYLDTVLKIKLSALEIDKIIKMRKPLIKLLQKHDVGNNSKGQKSSKTTN